MLLLLLLLFGADGGNAAQGRDGVLRRRNAPRSGIGTTDDRDRTGTGVAVLLQRREGREKEEEVKKENGMDYLMIGNGDKGGS